MVKAEDFIISENLLETTYTCTISHIASQKKEKEELLVYRDNEDYLWKSRYINIYGSVIDLPIEQDKNENYVIQQVCDWFNIRKRMN